MVDSQPPRALEPGDVVAAYSEPVGEWIAEQIIGLFPDQRSVAVAQLDWSGPEPADVADLGDLMALGRPGAACHYDWVLPRRYKIIGRAPLVREGPVNSYGFWSPGIALYVKRGGGDWAEQHERRLTAEEFASAQNVEPDCEIRHLTVTGIRELDCARLVARYPALTRLRLHGPGFLANAASLNSLSALQSFFAVDLFGMSAQDRLDPAEVPALESLWLTSVPDAYAKAMRAAWQPEERNGTHLQISKPRKPDWIAENMDNPLRGWDGDDEIPPALYQQVMAQYRKTRRAVLDLLAADPEKTDTGIAELERIGEDYGEEFNRLDEPTGFIDTVYREQLYEAVHFIVTEAETAAGRELPWAHDAVEQGVENVRDW